MDISKDILIRAAGGDLKAFECIYDVASGFVYNIAFRVTNNRPDAEEVTQDVFMLIFRKLKDFKFKSSFKTWVYRITFNTSINKYKQGKREKDRRQEFENISDSGPSSDKGAGFIDRENAEKTINYLLDKLSPEHKASILLREVEGLSYKEIAEVLRLNINTVRSRLKRARESMLENVKKEAITHGL